MKQAYRKFSKFLFTVVTGLGLCSLTLLLTDPTPSDPDSISPLATLASSTETGRGIASITGLRNSDTTLDLVCSDGAQTLETNSVRMRLKGPNCTADNKSPLTTEIRNKTNGFVATVFHHDPESFTTDYINLIQGKNEIDVKFQTEEQTVQKTITIVRAAKSDQPIKN